MRVRPTALWPLLFVVVAVQAFWWVSESPWSVLNSWWSEGALKVALWVVPAVLILGIRHRGSVTAAWQGLGFGGSAARGYVFGVLMTAPMALVLMALTIEAVPPGALVGGALLGPLAEEVLFRGFLLLWLVRMAGWRPWPALLVSAIAFGLAHADNLTSPLFSIGASWYLGRPDLVGRVLTSILFNDLPYVLMLSLGGVVFGWLVLRWGSLWPAVGLHSAINFWWLLLEGVEGPPVVAFGLAPAAHALSVALAIYLTFRWRPRVAYSPPPAGGGIWPAGNRGSI
jgi:membrane protease YdiL (CAAX protease family)